MFRNSDVSTISRRHFLTVAGSVAATSSLAIGSDSSSAKATPAPSPVKYVVTIDVTAPHISYSYPDPSGSKKIHNGYRLRVAAEDIIQWVVKAPTTVYSLTVMFVGETPLTDANKNPARYMVSGSDSNPMPPVPTHSDASGTYEYYVAVTDGNGQTYTDDPKIIVGGTGPIEEKMELRVDAHELYKGANELKSAAGSNEAMRQKIESIEKKIHEVIERLE